MLFTFKYWAISSIFLILFIVWNSFFQITTYQDFLTALSELIIPLIFSFLIFGLSFLVPKKANNALVYLLFFSISLTAIFGLTETLTGSHATSTSALFYGLSFYTVFFAYHLKQADLRPQHVWVAANPLLLFTGPIATFFKPITHKKFRKRLAYYLPFVVIGIFMFKVIATPLTEFFSLIEMTDIVSASIFAIIFELFVYANFCGLSLIIYGLFGIMGVRIPLNFRQPFSARNLIEFWKGWHISLSMVLKALFYTPVKGVLKKSKYGTYLAIFTVFLASALWHGITVNFMMWGLLHGTLFVLTIILLKARIRYVAPLLLIVGIVLGRMIFADSDTERLLAKLSFVYDGNTDTFQQILSMPQQALAALFLIVSLVLTEFFFAKQKQVAKRNYKFLRVPFSQMLLIGLFVLLISANIGVDYAVYGQR